MDERLPPEDVDRWVDEARVVEAADARARRHSLRRQLDAEATLRGVLLDLAERGDVVAVRTASGTAFRGTVRAVGADFVELRTDTYDVLVPLAAVTSVRTDGSGPAGGDRRSDDGSRALADVLSDLAAERAAVTVRTGVEQLTGRLVAVGQDVLTVELAGPEPATAYASLSSLAEVVLGSG